MGFKRFIEVPFFAVLLICSCFFVSFYTVRAESGINGNEAWIVGVINSTFEYEGKYYRAKPEYIAQATAYLNRDDVDLNDVQASKAVSLIYRHIAEGVSEGYLYEIDIETGEAISDKTEDYTKTTEESTDTTEDVIDKTTEISTEDTGNTTENTSTTETSFETTDPELYGTELPVDEHGAIILDYADDDTTDDDIRDIKEEVDLKELTKYEQDNGKSKTEDRPDKDKADAEVHIDEDSGEIYVGTGDDVKKIDQYFPDWLVSAITWISIVMFVITAIVIAAALISKCFVFRGKRRKFRKGHTRKRMLRRVFRKVLILTTVVSIILVLSTVVLVFVFFRSDTVMQNLNKGGYYRHEYTNYLAHAANEITTNEAVADFDGYVDILSYEEFLFKAKNEVMQSLSGGTASEKILHVNVANNIYDVKSEFRLRLFLPVVLAVISMLFGIAVMYFVDGIRNRGVRVVAMAFVVAGIVMLLGGIALRIIRPHTKIYADPDYLYYFIKEVVLSAERSFVLAGVFLIVTGFMFFGLYRSIRKKEEC